MNLTEYFSKQNISIALIWLFHISGLIGIIYSNASWFIKATPYNLLLSFVLIIINSKWNKKLLSELSETMVDASICGLGQAAPNPILLTMQHFSDEV